MHLVTGLRFGEVALRVEVHDSEPPLDDRWEEAVEVSFTSSSEVVQIAEWAGDRYPFGLPSGDYRVRYCARGVEQGRDVDQLYGEEPVDFYLLQFWPGAAGPDSILRQTSQAAAYWHRAHRGRPLPPAEQQAEDQRVADEQEQYWLFGSTVARSD